MIFKSLFIRNFRMASLLFDFKADVWAFFNDRIMLSKLAFVSYVGSEDWEPASNVSSHLRIERTQDWSYWIFSFIHWCFQPPSSFLMLEMSVNTQKSRMAAIIWGYFSSIELLSLKITYKEVPVYASITFGSYMKTSLNSSRVNGCC